VIDPVTAVGFGYILALFAVAFYVERRLAGTDPLLNVPAWVRAVVGGLALGGPWLVYFADLLPVSDGVVAHAVVLTAAAVLWMSAERLVGVAGQGGASAC
jgi:FtsH-binding integral membrane protein